MNKTVNVNLGGYFFHIDEIAYEKLSDYLEAIEQSLNDDADGEKNFRRYRDKDK